MILAVVLGASLLYSPSSRAAVAGNADSPTSLDLIDVDLDSGVISLDSASVYREQAVNDPAQLPPRYRSDRIGKDATSAMRQTGSLWPRLSNGTKAEIKSIRQNGLSPLRDSYETTHFVLHFTTKGKSKVPSLDANANGTSDYIDAAAAIFEQVWQREIVDLGYPAPKGWSPTNKYDVYFKELNFYGAVIPFDVQVDATTPIERTTSPTYLIAENDFAGFPPNDEDLTGNEPIRTGALKVTAAHEFMHALQFNINISQPAWVFEAHSTWVEDILYDSVNDWRPFIRRFLLEPDINLFDRPLYGAAFYLHWVSENYGIAALHQLWDAMRTVPMDTAFRTVIFGGTWEGMKNFAPAEYLLNISEYTTYPPSVTFALPVNTVRAVHDSYPVAVTVPPNSATIPNHAPWGLGANFVEFTPGPAAGRLTVSFDGRDGVAWRAFAVAMPMSAGPAAVIPINLNANSAGNVVVHGFGTTWAKVALVTTIVDNTGTAEPYSYAASIT